MCCSFSLSVFVPRGVVLFTNTSDRHSNTLTSHTYEKHSVVPVRNFEVLEHVYLPFTVLSLPLMNPHILLTPSWAKTKE